MLYRAVVRIVYEVVMSTTHGRKKGAKPPPDQVFTGSIMKQETSIQVSHSKTVGNLRVLDSNVSRSAGRDLSQYSYLEIEAANALLQLASGNPSKPTDAAGGDTQMADAPSKEKPTETTAHRTVSSEQPAIYSEGTVLKNSSAANALPHGAWHGSTRNSTISGTHSEDEAGLGLHTTSVKEAHSKSLKCRSGRGATPSLDQHLPPAAMVSPRSLHFLSVCETCGSAAAKLLIAHGDASLSDSSQLVQDTPGPFTPFVGASANSVNERPTRAFTSSKIATGLATTTAPPCKPTTNARDGRVSTTPLSSHHLHNNIDPTNPFLNKHAEMQNADLAQLPATPMDGPPSNYMTAKQDYQKKSPMFTTANGGTQLELTQLKDEVEMLASDIRAQIAIG